MKNKFLVFILFFLSMYSFSKNKLYYIEISKEYDIPKIIENNKKIVLKHHDNYVTEIFSKYDIYGFKKAFPTSVTPFLQNIYILEVNKAGIIEDFKGFKNYFRTIEETSEPELLYTPNDYHYPTGSSNPHKSLDLINIKDAWDYTHGNPKFKIGISDTPIRQTHEDLIGKVTSLVSYTIPDSHGTAVASHAAANTDNNAGIPGTGFNSAVLYNYTGFNQLLELSQNGARVVNASWHNGICTYSSVEQAIIDEIYKNGTVIIAAAGNTSTCGGPFSDVYPASYNHVISISSVGYEDVGYTYNNIPMLWRDRVEQIIGDPASTHHTNDKVDLLASGFNVLGATADSDSSYGGAWGTSLSAPQVSGVVALLFAVNNCLSPDEIESILKLSSSDLDSIPENLPYVGKIGAGRVDAGKATKMAWQMNPNNGGEILISDRKFERWHFELMSSPQKVRIKNQSFTNESDITIKAKDYILLEGDVLLSPTNGNSDHLYIADDSCNNFSPAVTKSQNKQNQSDLLLTRKDMGHQIEIYPNPSSDFIYLKNIEKMNNGEVSISIYDLAGRLVINKSHIPIAAIASNGLDIHHLNKGEYLIEIISDKEKISKKFLKK